jgi:hypothetical protein
MFFASRFIFFSKSTNGDINANSFWQTGHKILKKKSHPSSKNGLYLNENGHSV